MPDMGEVKISKEMAKEAYEFAEKIDIIQNMEFDFLFSNNTLSKLEMTTAQSLDELLTESQFHIDYYNKNVHSKSSLKNLESHIKRFFKNEFRIRHLREMVLGEHITAYFEGKGRMTKTSLSTAEHLLPKVNKLVDDYNIEFLNEKPHEGVKTYSHNVDFIVDEKVLSISFNGKSVLPLINSINKILNELGSTNAIFIYEGVFFSLGYLLSYGLLYANRSNAKYEHNKFIPFYYKDNLEVVGLNKLTQEQMERFKKIAEMDDPNEIYKEDIKKLAL